MKIGFVLDDSLDTNDGVQQYVRTLGNYFARHGHEVHYLVGHTTRTDIPHVHSLARNAKVRFNQNRMSMPLPASCRKVQEILKREKFDVLHVQLPHSPFLAGRIITAAPKRTAIVGTFHIAPHSRGVQVANQMLRVLVRSSLKRFDSVISVSPVAQDFAAKTFGLQSAVVPNAVPLSNFYGAMPIARYQKSKNIVFLGRLVPRKGALLLLQAVALLRQNHDLGETTKVIICGGGPLEARLQRFAQDNNLGDVVEFAGVISEADKPRYLAAADVAVFPSTGGESFGIVLVEALAAARGAVLAGNNPGYARLLQNHPEALFDPSNTPQFAQKLADYILHDDKRSSAHAWQQTFVRQFDVSEVAAQVLAVYNIALRKRNK